MRIVILDGQVNPENKEWSVYLTKLSAGLEKKGHGVKHYIIKDLKINRCTGCFGCWVKTPGVCVISDDNQEINRATINADFVLWASPLVMGFPSRYLKKKIDRFIPLIHPYFEVVNGEAHHRSRYPKYPLYGLLAQPEKEDSEDDVRLVAQIFARTTLNAKSRLTFSATTDQPVEEVLTLVENCESSSYTQPPVFVERKLEKIDHPKKLLLINGSSRGPRGNTPILLRKIMKGYQTSGNVEAEMLHLVGQRDMREVVHAYTRADSVILGFPLYTDCMPGLVKEFIEALENRRTSKDNPAMGFLVQSGFPESAHSRHVEQYLMKLSEKLISSYLGTLTPGGCEGVRLMPDSWNRKLFNTLEKLGSELAQQGGLDQKTVKALIKVEKYPPLAIPFFKLLVKTPMMQMYWNSQLKENGVFEERFAQPYLKTV